jgi:hypothetical protein
VCRYEVAKVEKGKGKGKGKASERQRALSSEQLLDETVRKREA